jgi:hypothetical protein
MSPIPGIVASQISGHLTPTTGFCSIATTTLSSTSSTITFSAIPQVYKHLQIRAYHQSSAAAWTLLTLNSDSTASNYVSHRLTGDGTTASAEANTSTQQNRFFTSYPYFGSSVIDFLDYTNTNKYKTIRGLHGWVGDGTGGMNGEVNFMSDLWMSTSAITSITISFPSTTFQAYSKFALYGIQGA